ESDGTTQTENDRAKHGESQGHRATQTDSERAEHGDHAVERQASLRGGSQGTFEKSVVVGRPAEARRTRHIPNATRRAVVARDGARCTYVEKAGRRCDATAFLELHHELPWALGGDAQVANIRLLCRAHNRLLAEHDFGRARVEASLRGQRCGAASVRSG
ncbi:MAG TPA: HNH endonuclease signature motif containing protein, partial [Polyangiaceae bacterium]|nr:HNH endonuclease signature motif containing protein [Polyangiaceae bacterium]